MADGLAMTTAITAWATAINYGAGGPTDVEGRLIARHLAKHIP